MQFRHLEQPWRVLHAATALAIDRARRRTRPPDFDVMKSPMSHAQPRPWSTAKIIGVARKEMDQMLRALESDARRLGKYPEFHKLWLRNGGSLAFAKYPKGKMSKIHATLLDNWSAQADTPSQTLTIATDGSGRRDGRAGYGVTARWLAPDEDPSLPPLADAEPTLIEHYGPVDTDPASPMWIGASRATNNTGELTAVYVALQTARAHCTAGDTARILPDSMMALCTTTGAWKPCKHKALIARNVKELAALRSRGIDILFEHVRAHRGHSMNERADKLADLGAQTTTHFRAGRPLRQRETYQYSSSLPRPTIRPILPPDTVPD